MVTGIAGWGTAVEWPGWDSFELIRWGAEVHGATNGCDRMDDFVHPPGVDHVFENGVAVARNRLKVLVEHNQGLLILSILYPSWLYHILP